MSIRLISGIPGSGKTYYIVYNLIYGDLLNKYFVFHNIPELKLENKHLKYFGEEDIENNIQPEKLFSLSYQKELNEEIKGKYNKNILWIIDECDKHGFGRTSSIIKEWLSMHRHLGQDVYLLSQSKWNIARDYMNLIEVEIQGKRGFLFDAFIYSWFSNGERISTTRLPKKKNVYESYRSFFIKEISKPKSKLIKYGGLLGIIGVLLMSWFMFYGLPNKFKGNNPKQKTAIMQNKNNDENKISYPEEITNKYYYTGTDGKYYYINDEFGNIYNMHIKEKSSRLKLMLTDDQSRNAIFDTGKGTKDYYNKYLNIEALGASGRASKREREDERQSEVKREVWINIF